jgi:hypothetical protein
LELIIAKDALKISSPSIDQVLSHAFFKEFEATFNQNYSESLSPSKLSFDLPSKDSVVKASHKTEQRLKDEQKLVKKMSKTKYFLIQMQNFQFKVKSQKRVTQSQKAMIGEEEKRKQQSRQKVM